MSDRDNFGSTDAESPSEATPEVGSDTGHDASRRRFGKAALGAAPIIMTLASRPVWATGKQCTASALASANPSNPVDLDTCKACSPGYWHLSGACWPPGYHRDTKFWQQFGYDRTKYKQKKDAGVVTRPGYPTYTEILTVLDTPLRNFFPPAGPVAIFKAARAALAACLNAAHPDVPFALSESAVKASLINLFPLTPFSRDSFRKPTAPNTDLNSFANQLSTYWDEGDDKCILAPKC